MVDSPIGLPYKKSASIHDLCRILLHGMTLILITSFQLSKGLNLPGLETMFVHDMPWEFEEYLAAVGRVGRIGNTGKAIVFFNVERDVAMAFLLSDHLEAHEQEVPEWLKDVCDKGDFDEYLAAVGRVGRTGNTGKAKVFFNVERDLGHGVSAIRSFEISWADRSSTITG